MIKTSQHSVFGAFAISLFLALPQAGFAQLDSNFVRQSRVKIDSVRKRDCKLSVSNPAGSAAGLTVRVKQIRNHFGFGASIGFNEVNNVPGYAESFLKFYEWAVFENDMKWPSTDPTANGPDYAKADSLIRFCKKHDIQVRGHNLFWNQQEDWFPSWTLPLSQTDFKAAVDKRIQDAMTHFKGKVAHWDIVNEIIHGSVLQDHSGDPSIVHSIFTKARAIDTAAKLTVNDFNILVWNSTEDYIANVKSMLNAKVPIHIVGCEGHFGDQLKQDYAAKLERVATLGLPIWVTELDFTDPNPPDAFEKLMRTFYGHRLVGGVMMWVWWGGNKWREDLNSHVVNTDFTNTPLGDRYLKLRKEWTTNDSGKTDAAGTYSFRGYQGKYEVTVVSGSDTTKDTLYLEPATGTKQWSVALKAKPVQVAPALSQVTFQLRIHGQPISIPAMPGSRLMVSLFDFQGKQIAKRILAAEAGNIQLPGLKAGTYHYRVEAENGKLAAGRICVL